MNLLVSNVGSTSLKFKLYAMPQETVLCQGKVERVGSSDSAIYTYENLQTPYRHTQQALCIPTYTQGIELFLADFTDSAHGVCASADELDAIGFKTVLAKGYYGVHLLTDDVLCAMRSSRAVAPVHNGAYLEAIGQFRALLPQVPMVGVFETAFHTTIPLSHKLYGLPYEWAERYGVLRMGYHGASHAYAAQQAAQLGKAGKVISCHLGGSCSICAIENGKSVDTSFGLSLQTGVLHGNRCGDADPYLVPYLLTQGLSLDEVLAGMSQTGGLLGLSGVSGDMRQLEAAAQGGNERAQLAIDVFVHDILRYIGSFYMTLGGLDQLVFTGGIGEKSALLRKAVCQKLAHICLVLDDTANAHCTGGIISSKSSAVLVSVIAANEELGVARQSYRCLQNPGSI